MDSRSGTQREQGNGASFGKDMTTGSVARNLLSFSIPMLLGNVIHTAYSIINTAWVGNGLGTSSMAAITISFPIVFILLAVAGGLTLATNVLVSQSFGAKDFERVKTVARNSLLLTGAAGFVCLIVGHFAASLLVTLTNTPADVAPIAEAYIRLFVLTTPFLFVTFHFAATLRGVGDSKTPLYFQAGSLLLTGILDPFLMFGWLGLPRLGLNGTAVATIICQSGSCILLGAYLVRINHIAAPDWRRWKIDWGVSLLTLKIGLPSMLQQSFVAVGILMVVSLVNPFGAHSAAAYGIAMRIDQLAFMPALAMSMAASTLAGQNIGARHYGRVSEVLRWSILISCAFTLPAAAASISIPDWLMGLFSSDADVIRTGAHCLRVAGIGYLFVAVMFSSNGVINGSGHTIATTLFTLVVFYVVRIPVGILLSEWLDSVDGIWYAILMSYVAGVSMSLSYYRSGRWRKPVHGRKHAAEASEEAPTAEEAVEADVH